MIRVEKDKCSGCSACYAACPVQCITMKMDDEGFLYPVISEDKCIHCNKCSKICPFLNDMDSRSSSIHLYGCQDTDDVIRKRSTSGGMFSALAEFVINHNGVVYGAGYDEKMYVLHKCAKSVIELENLRASKYVQSDIQNCFAEIKDNLKQDRLVLFVGTPCQVEGLRYYLNGMKLDKLILAEIICFGVPSPGLYMRWISYIENKYGSKMRELYFRDKKYGFSGVNVKAILENGRVLEDNMDLKSYGKTMFSKVGLRRSCYNCQFRSKRKLADFTLGDTWEIGKYNKKMDDDKGTTLVGINTLKGENIFRKLVDQKNIRAVEVESYKDKRLDDWLKESRRIYELNEEERTELFHDMNYTDYGELMQKVFPNTVKDYVNNYLKRIMYYIPGTKKIFQIIKQRKVKRSKRG